MADAVDKRVLYAYSNVSVERASMPEKRALYAYSDVGASHQWNNTRALYVYSEIGGSPTSISKRALYAYSSVVPFVDPDTPLEVQLLSSAFALKEILRTK